MGEVPEISATVDPPLESTASLLESIRGGDASARQRLIERYLPRLTRWARGRVPPNVRGMKETQDLVQETFLRTLGHIGEFENRREGAFLVYLRRTFLNLVRDELRRAARQPAPQPVDGDLPDGGVTPLDQAIGRELVDRYEAALLELPEHQREAVILRVEMGFTYQEIAAALDIAEPNTARMMVARALKKLAARLDE